MVQQIKCKAERVAQHKGWRSKKGGPVFGSSCGMLETSRYVVLDTSTLKGQGGDMILQDCARSPNCNVRPVLYSHFQSQYTYPLCHT